MRTIGGNSMDITREQLYEKLWTEGVGRTQTALGLKQPELKKLCEDFQIPRPSSGYWTALSLGKSPEKIQLPPKEENRLIHTEDYIKRRPVKKEKPVLKAEHPIKTADGKYEPRELPAEEPDTIYTVPEKFVVMDPILMDTKQKLHERNSHDDNPWSKKNPYKSSPKKWLDINVYQEQENRALRIFATIWRAAEEKGYHLKINVEKGSYSTYCTTYFVVREHEIRVELKEISKRVKDENHSWTTQVGSGRLKFICYRGTYYYRLSQERVAAQDTEHTFLEDKIERIIEVLGEIADERDQAEVERKLAEERRKKEEELRRQEEEQKRLEAEEQARIEARRDEERHLVTDLLLEAERTRTASIIREYANQYEIAMVGQMDAEELRTKVEWMRKKADYIDPFVNCEDEWLQPTDIKRLFSPEIIKTTEEKRPSYGYGNEKTYSYWQIKNMWWHK